MKAYKQLTNVWVCWIWGEKMSYIEEQSTSFKFWHFSSMKSNEWMERAIGEGQVYQDRNTNHQFSELRGITKDLIKLPYLAGQDQVREHLKPHQNVRKAISLLKYVSEIFTIFFNSSCNYHDIDFQAYQFYLEEIIANIYWVLTMLQALC